MLKSNLCDYTDAYILVTGKITITGQVDDDAARQEDERNKGVIFKYCPPFTKCINTINGTDIVFIYSFIHLCILIFGEL